MSSGSAAKITASAQVVCHGASLTRGENASHGIGTATGPTYPGVLAVALGPSWQVTNLGTSGLTLDQLAAEAPTRVDTLFRPELRHNILIVLAGTNNLGLARETGEVAFGKLVAYCNSRRAAQPWQILVATLPVAAYPNAYPADFDTHVVRYDALIRENWPTFANGLVDVAADPRLGLPGAEYDPTYFHAEDHTHLTDAGYALVGVCAAEAVRALVSADRD